MALKTMNDLSAVHAEKAKNAGRRSQKKGSRVTEERAKAQRAKLDTQAEARQIQEDQEPATQKTQNKRAGRQEGQAKRRIIEMLIEAYIQDHIGGNHSDKTVELSLARFDGDVSRKTTSSVTQIEPDSRIPMMSVNGCDYRSIQ